jgi:hypothetical protein
MPVAVTSDAGLAITWSCWADWRRGMSNPELVLFQDGRAYVRRPVVDSAWCPACSGSGRAYVLRSGYGPCPSCKGRGGA